MAEPGQRRPDLQEHQVYLLRDHIARGIGLIKSGQATQAYRHFLHLPDKNGLDVFVSEGGKTFPVMQLLSEDDLVYCASTVARHSHAYPREAVLGTPNLGTLDFSKTFEDFPDRYDPDLVSRFRHEQSVVAAEEWIHILQYATRPDLQSANIPGRLKAEAEVDVAVYLDREGVYLSADFLTRYPARARWYLTQHPEREKELLEFDRKYHRYLQ